VLILWVQLPNLVNGPRTRRGGKGTFVREPGLGISLSPWCRVLMQKLILALQVNTFPSIYGTRRFISRHHNSPPFGPILSQVHPSILRSPILFLNNNYNISFPATCTPSKWFPLQNSVCLSLVSHYLPILRPACFITIHFITRLIDVET